jgi:hypothetical protein
MFIWFSYEGKVHKIKYRLGVSAFQEPRLYRQHPISLSAGGAGKTKQKIWSLTQAHCLYGLQPSKMGSSYCFLLLYLDGS